EPRFTEADPGHPGCGRRHPGRSLRHCDGADPAHHQGRDLSCGIALEDRDGRNGKAAGTPVSAARRNAASPDRAHQPNAARAGSAGRVATHTGSTTIERMLKIGTHYRTVLRCGHAWNLTGQEVEERQLFIGKKV